MLHHKLNMSNYFEIKDGPELKTSEIMAKMREKFSVHSYYDDERLDKDFPPPKKATTRYFKKLIEADPENANKSANEVDQATSITLRERLLMELDYFEETGEHLDIDNVTLCAGSRHWDGSVPGVGWGAGSRRVYVDWFNTSPRGDRLRVRSAVTLETLNLDTAPSELPEVLVINNIKYVRKND